MNISNVAIYLAERKRFNFQVHTVEGIDFNLISLTDTMIQELKVDNETYEGMVLSAAKYGVSVGRERVCDDAEMSADLEEMWSLEQFSECEPSLIHQVGLVVCEISGLTEYIEDQRKLEEDIKAEDERAAEAKAHLEAEAKKEFNIGGEMVPGDTELGNLDPSQLAADALVA